MSCRKRVHTYILRSKINLELALASHFSRRIVVSYKSANGPGYVATTKPTIPTMQTRGGRLESISLLSIQRLTDGVLPRPLHPFPDLTRHPKTSIVNICEAVREACAPPQPRSHGPLSLCSPRHRGCATRQLGVGGVAD